MNEEPLRRYRLGDLSVRIDRDLDRAWERCIDEMEASGVPCPLDHRREWLTRVVGSEARFLSVVDDRGRCRCCFPVRVIRPRSAPGHNVLRVDRFRSSADRQVSRAALVALRRFAADSGGTLRAELEEFASSEQELRCTDAIARKTGFEARERSQLYTHTVVVDLTPDESDIMASFHSSGRRYIREPGKKGFPVRRVHSAEYASRMAELTSETFDRTGGNPPERNWTARLDFSRNRPDLYAVFGTFHPDREGPRSLLAFVSGCHHGDHVTYADSASTRRIDSNVSLSYAPTWKLMQWGKRHGAAWFDLGGIPVSDPDEELEGISRFKRYFSTDVRRVRKERVYHARPFRSQLSDRIRATAEWTRSLELPV